MRLTKDHKLICLGLLLFILLNIYYTEDFQPQKNNLAKLYDSSIPIILTIQH